MMTAGGAKKPLIWERLKWTERFSFVEKSKVVHVVGDDDSRRAWETDEWAAEHDQSRTGMSRLRDWVKAGEEDHLREEDIIISASVDEILAPETLLRLKSCGLTQ